MEKKLIGALLCLTLPWHLTLIQNKMIHNTANFSHRKMVPKGVWITYWLPIFTSQQSRKEN